LSLNLCTFIFADWGNRATTAPGCSKSVIVLILFSNLPTRPAISSPLLPALRVLDLPGCHILHF
jgi:hypothetical protein